MKPIISIIVPIYKTEDTLIACIESLLHQTIGRIEIVLVDDGSPDNCAELCDIYAAQYDNIRVIHQNNAGLSSARNMGLRCVTGEYIGFVDSDDYVALDMYDKMYLKMKGDQSDICICAYYTMRDDGKRVEHLFESIPERMEKQEILQYLILPLIGLKPGAKEQLVKGFVCRNLYRREVLEKYEFLSEKLYFAEDIVSDLDIFPRCRSISIVNECLYYYRYNTDSLSNKYRPQVYVMLNNLLKKKKQFLVENDLYEKERPRIYTAGVNDLLVSIATIRKGKLGVIRTYQEIKKAFSQDMLWDSIQKIDIKTVNIKAKVVILVGRILF